MTLKEHDARELPDDLRYRDLADFARNIRRAIESPLKPTVHGVAREERYAEGPSTSVDRYGLLSPPRG